MPARRGNPKVGFPQEGQNGDARHPRIQRQRSSRKEDGETARRQAHPLRMMTVRGGALVMRDPERGPINSLNRAAQPARELQRFRCTPVSKSLTRSGIR